MDMCKKFFGTVCILFLLVSSGCRKDAEAAQEKEIKKWEQASQKWSLIQPGMSEHEVTQILGQPNQIVAEGGERLFFYHPKGWAEGKKLANSRHTANLFLVNITNGVVTHTHWGY